MIFFHRFLLVTNFSSLWSNWKQIIITSIIIMSKCHRKIMTIMIMLLIIIVIFIIIMIIKLTIMVSII